MVIAGLGLAALVVVGGVKEFIISHHTTPTPAPSSVRFTAPPSPTTTAVSPQSLGTTLLTYKGHTGAVYALSWSPNGQYIASGSEDTMVRVWNIASGETLSTYQGHAGLFNAVFAVDWASNGSRIASGGADKTVQVMKSRFPFTILFARSLSLFKEGHIKAS